MEHRPYDIIVYGASGFTGQFAAVEAVRTCKGKKIGLAGRTKAKLQEVVKRIEKELGSDCDSKDIGIVVADNKNEESIREMCRQTKVVVNCVGPFRWYGELVVASCVEMGTNYVDITGEPEFMQTCQIKYHKAAEEKGVHIVSACGFDSIPADMGLEILRERFPGVLTAAESYIHIRSKRANYGTYLTIIHSVQNRNSVKDQHKTIFRQKIPYTGPRLRLRNGGFSNSENRWFIPFLGADPSVVKRTQYYESMVHDRMPVQYFAYFTVPSIFYMICFAIFGVVLFVLTKFSFGIKLLENHPKFFTFGTFCKEGPTREEIDAGSFKIVFHGKGYKEEPESRTSAGRPDQSMSLKFSGPEAGYIFTSTCVVAAAATILDDNLINKGGVLTPASAFRKTKFVERLEKRNVKIEVMN